jgi:hypothetical protein
MSAVGTAPRVSALFALPGVRSHPGRLLRYAGPARSVKQPRLTLAVVRHPLAGERADSGNGHDPAAGRRVGHRGSLPVGEDTDPARTWYEWDALAHLVR